MQYIMQITLHIKLWWEFCSFIFLLCTFIDEDKVVYLDSGWEFKLFYDLQENSHTFFEERVY